MIREGKQHLVRTKSLPTNLKPPPKLKGPRKIKPVTEASPNSSQPSAEQDNTACNSPSEVASLFQPSIFAEPHKLDSDDLIDLGYVLHWPYRLRFSIFHLIFSCYTAQKPYIITLRIHILLASTIRIFSTELQAHKVIFFNKKISHEYGF